MDFTKYSLLRYKKRRAKMTDRITVELFGSHKTLLLPLWARAKESQKPNPLLNDKRALDIINNLDYDFKNLEHHLDLFYQLSQVVRAKHFDDEVREFIKNNPLATIINLGAGLDSSFERVDNGLIQWFDIDVPEVIDLRKKFIPETERNHYISKSIFDKSWHSEIKKTNSSFLFIACGVIPYLKKSLVKNLFISLSNSFPTSELIFDSMSKMFRVLGNITVLTTTGMGSRAFMKWGINNAKNIEKWDPRIKVIDEYQIFSCIELNDMSHKDFIKIKNANKMKGLPMIHIKF
jgi:O-methyltransferase involved in polyketide biosynthesis